MLKNDVIWPEHRQFRSKTKWEPIGFFSECLCNALEFDLMLGFFSSSAIQVLADGFAIFLHRGGKMRLIINDVLSQQDIDCIEKGINSDIVKSLFNLSNLQQIKDTLSVRDKHFFDCLSWLIQQNRIEIKIIRPMNGIGVSHTKLGVFSDGLNEIAFDGSCNFSQTALIDNIESISASCDWDGVIDKAKVCHIKESFQQVFNEKDPSLEYLTIEDVKANITTCFKPKSVLQLLEEEQGYLDKTPQFISSFPSNINYALKRAKDRIAEVLEHLKKTDEELSDSLPNPSFPYPSGPRDYQMKAFENWKNNKQRGLFAMATGTGKTITALNCLLEIYKRAGYYKAIILVPTVTLVDQWCNECRSFHFDNIIKVYSKNPHWQKQVDDLLLQESVSSDSNASYVIISTYASFARDNVFYALIKYPKKRLLLIADEAHNMASDKIKVRMEMIPYLRRIGLSATPKRQFDDSGNKAINDFFGVVGDNYTFTYTMAKAIEEGRLCQYYYYPHLVYLTTQELEEYSELSEKIVRFFNPNTLSFNNDEILMALLLKRKRIIHKAVNKKAIFRDILQNRFKEKGNLKYSLIYVPEGNDPSDFCDTDFDEHEKIADDQESQHLIDEYTRMVCDIDSHTTVKQFTSATPDRNQILQDFASGKLEVLTSMKCLDEGIDVPRSEFAVFCASTGNPRQFIQRRGRILRTHKDKPFAVIHDLVVAPQIDESSPSYFMEKSLLDNEMKRVREFARLAENSSDTVIALEEILDYYKLPIF